VIPSFAETANEPEEERDGFLWVGGMVDFKNPLAFVELAQLVPEAPFFMVATERGPEWRGLAQQVRMEAASVSNLQLLPACGRDVLFNLYRRAIALVNTSLFEGFPNTFLEAWARGTPVLSLSVDPDGVIRRDALGVVADGDLCRLADNVRAYVADVAIATSTGAAGRAYLRRAHDPAVVGPQWTALISEILL
jgi:glycosyltransferase involved in cell wall biosynthesis